MRKIISFVILATFLFTNSAYSSNLRVPVGKTQPRVAEAIENFQGKDIFVDGINLSERWKELVSKDNGRTFATESNYDGQEVTLDGIDPGDTLQLGLKLDATDKIIYWGRNETKNKDLSREVKLEPIKDSEGGDTGFVKVLNEYRALRPNATKTKPIGRQADPKSVHPDNEKFCPFGCVDSTKGNSLLKREASWEGQVNGRVWRAQFNAATFEENGHFLWVPDINDPKQRRSQRVLYEDILDISALSRKSSNMIFFYNDPHAGGTVNHIHFQSFYRNDNNPMAIEKSELSPLAKIREVEISRLKGYFIEGLVFNNDINPQLVDIIFRFVDLLQNRQIPFNLIFSKNRIYLIPRNPDGEIVSEFPTGILASAELCGRIIIVDRKTYGETDYKKVEAAFGKISLSEERIKGLIEMKNIPPAVLSSLESTPVLFLDKEVAANPVAFKEAMGQLRQNEGNIPVVLLTKETKDTLEVKLKGIDLTGVQFRAQAELGLQDLQWDEDERVSLIAGIDNLKCIPLAETPADTFRGLRKTRDGA